MTFKLSAEENSCMTNAVIVCRGFLGYKTPIPFDIPKPAHKGWIIENAHKFFPNHKVYVWCVKEDGNLAKNYKGERIEDEESHKYLFIFNYFVDHNDDSHAVIGFPVMYGNMGTSVIIGVRLEKDLSLSKGGSVVNNG
jgi:hypothetical protein